MHIANLWPLQKLLDKCPTFLTAAPKSSAAGTSMFKMLGGGGPSATKQKFQLKDHQVPSPPSTPSLSLDLVQFPGFQFLLQPVLLTVHCYQWYWGLDRTSQLISHPI